ncbi:MAG: M17 family peptidase N-terminal domain-containing protein, partial [Acidimicrobiia bacterium]
MQARTVRSFSAATADAVIVGMYPERRAAAGTNGVTRALGGWVRGALEAAGFEGEAGQTATLPNPTDTGPGAIVVVGLGSDLDLEGLRQAAGHGRRALPGKVRAVATTLHQVDLDGAVGAVLEGIALADYVFETYKSKSDSRSELNVELVGGPKELPNEVESSKVIAEAVGFARDLVNEPPKGKAPLDLARRITSWASKAEISFEVWSGDDLVEREMAGLLAVGGGSDRGPAMVKL